jgi:hypothetical protein
LIAKRMLLNVLFDWNQKNTLPITMDIAFKNIWADNADAISEQYSGTGALKTDYTRTGNRTYRGAFRDLYNSVSRYLYSNFSDAYKQDSMDLFFGRVAISGALSPFSSVLIPVQLRIAVPILVGILLAYFAGRTLSSWKSPIDGLSPFIILFACVLLGYAVLWVVRTHGTFFVQYPRLQPPPVAMARGTNSGRQRAVPDPHHKAHII